ncbi:MAG: transporter substrate-binding domain-containing protein [Eubacteriales bacterium]|nr:transporter substrate-binding domain-containing protein [Eubacteriales bacterium]
MRIRNRLRRQAALLLAALALFMPGTAGAANRVQDRTVRVAYPIQAGLTEVDEYGEFSGYTYEYLEEIAQYTGWDYEFVQAPGDIDQSLSTLLEMVGRGEIDLIGGMLYSAELSERYDYASRSYGTAETVLQALYDEPRDIVINASVEQELHVAVHKSSKRLREELEEYCRANRVTPLYVECDSEEEMLRALRDGRAEVLLNSSVNLIEGVRTIAAFSPKPFYFVTQKNGDAALMAELNAAVSSIEQTDPQLSSSLYDKYFTFDNDALRLSGEELAYIARAGTLRVGMLSGRPPFQYIDEKTGEKRGIAPDLLQYISEKTGLKFELVAAETPEQEFQMAEDGEIDLLSGMTYDYALAREYSVVMSRPYVSAQYILLMNQDVSEDSLSGKKLAMTTTSTYEGETLGTVVYYDTLQACVDAVHTGEADYTYMDGYSAQYYANRPEYRNLKLIPQTYEPRRVCFAMPKPVSPELLNILNKAVLTIPAEELQAIIYSNTFYKQDFTLSAWVREYPFYAIGVVGAVLTVIILLLGFNLRQRARRTREIAGELEKRRRVYRLFQDYFFEYDFASGHLVLSIPDSETKAQGMLEYDLLEGVEDPEIEQARRQFLALIQSGGRTPHEIQIYHEDDRALHWVSVLFDTVCDSVGAAVYAVGKIANIDEQRQEKERLRRRAELDSLTHVLNAETVRRSAQRAMADIPEGRRDALLLLDIDRFKTINDTYGHMEGDRALIEVAAVIRRSFREADLVGRPGGDEFMIYMKRADAPAVVRNRCNALCAGARQVKMRDGTPLTVSIGVAWAEKGGVYADVFRAADEALYRAKKNGRDRFEFAG